jgi:hypothetical protein
LSHHDVAHLAAQRRDVALGAVAARFFRELFEVPESLERMSALLLGKRQVPQDVRLVQHRVCLWRAE